MTTWNAGSIGSVALNIIDNVPTAISGTIPVFVESAVEKIKNYNGDSITTTGFDAKYMPTILNFVLADMAQAMAIQGTDASNVRLGDFSVSKGKESSISSEAQAYLVKANQALDELGRDVTVAKAFD